MTYPGGKNGAGIYQRIINHIPPHDIFIEMFMGSGAILRHKKPATRNIGIDRSLKAINLVFDLCPDRDDIELVHDCAFRFLKRFKPTSKTLFYFDPPYVMATRKTGEIYDYELTDEDHNRLLSIIVKLKGMVMVSGYRCDLYDQALAGFHRIDYQTQTRGGMVDESLWMNFPPPNELHDYSFLGDNYRERERIKKKKDRWKDKLSEMPRLERLAIMQALKEASSEASP